MISKRNFLGKKYTCCHTKLLLNQQQEVLGQKPPGQKFWNPVGILYDQDQQKVKNHIILIFKKFLYENRDCPDKVNVHTFKNHLKRITQTEYFIATKTIL